MLAIAQFMVVLDVTIVNVALPAIQTDLGFSAEGLQWVVNGYTLAFGGLLLLGGRMSDILGRRRLFLIGLGLFTAASLAGGFATSDGLLIAARAVQGVGAALLSPAALALLTVTFPAGRERNIALGVWGALAGIGGTLGVVAGGVLVDSLGWEWIFFVNVPVAALAIAATPMFITESRRVQADSSFDVAGAVLGTLGLLAVVGGVIRTEAAGWGSAEVLSLFAAGIALLAGFVAVEARAKDPLVPLRLFRVRGLSVSAIALALNGGAFLGMFFLTALFLQQVHGDSALEAGAHFVPMGIAAIASAVVGAQLVTRFGTRSAYLGGTTVGAVGLLLLSQAGADSSYAGALLPGLIVFGLGLPLVGVANQIAAVAEVPHEDAGAASGVITAAFQVGGAIGLALISTAATTRTGDALAAGAAQADALAQGFERGMMIAAGLAIANLVVGLIRAPRIQPDAAMVAEASV
ncbi:DHA2 family efflux MFS transporter permease subunit [Solirubrobacter deserti]|uniref:DHA2 family efflux MFS transporter permease subunit n=1 Tax=Solirubrobacter deserti TaxID=2282478 RepID=A0ABT4RKJ8_9ACTN|nr:DHA2 family efflux MFS transporter permease subunit [Solirubrobacter deserti]MDA0139059.1 DHA2 family efflux MFS transporter permease subunit [Solirubrobacter deserti]